MTKIVVKDTLCKHSTPRLNQNSRRDRYNRFPPRFRDYLVDKSMEKSASDIIVKSSNSDGSGNDPCKTRWERPGLLRGNQGKAQTIQVAGFHRRLASTNLSLLFRALLLSSALRSSIRSSFFFHPSTPPHPYRFPPLPPTHFLSLRAFALFIVSVSFQAFHTVYKVEALN